MRINQKNGVESLKQDIEAEKTQSKKVLPNDSNVNEAHTKTGKPSYSVELSNSAQRMRDSYNTAFDVAKNTDPVREKRVADLKKQRLTTIAI